MSDDAIRYASQMRDFVVEVLNGGCDSRRCLRIETEGLMDGLGPTASSDFKSDMPGLTCASDSNSNFPGHRTFHSLALILMESPLRAHGLVHHDRLRPCVA